MNCSCGPGMACSACPPVIGAEFEAVGAVLKELYCWYGEERVPLAVAEAVVAAIGRRQTMSDEQRLDNWRLAVDRYFAPAGMALADREQGALRDLLSVRDAEITRLREAIEALCDEAERGFKRYLFATEPMPPIVTTYAIRGVLAGVVSTEPTREAAT